MRGGDVARVNRTVKKKAETKQKIIDTAIKLFKVQGVEATSMERIAREADIAKGTLYNYFPVKEAIIEEHIRSISQKYYAKRIPEILHKSNIKKGTLT